MKAARTKKAVAAELPLRTVVSYFRKFAGVFMDVPECVYASVESYRHEDTWLADCHMSLPIRSREQWNTVRRFATRDEAAAYAAAFVVEAERIVAAVKLGEAPFMPHRAMAAACKAACDADATVQRVAASCDRMKLDSARRDFETLWFRARDFRDFTLERRAA